MFNTIGRNFFFLPTNEHNENNSSRLINTHDDYDIYIGIFFICNKSISHYLYPMVISNMI